jgi:hypothetical protein
MEASARFAVPLLLTMLVCCAASAATINVSTTNDVIASDGLCSLREAIINANGGSQLFNAPGECAKGSGTDTISVPAGNYTLTIPKSGADDATTGDLTITSSMSIVGQGNPTIRGGAGWSDRIFDVVSGTVSITGLTVTGGNVSVTSGVTGGGGIRNNAALTLNAVTVTGNAITQSGGALAIGGGIYVTFSGTLTIVNSTISNNTAPTGGGLWTYGNTTMKGTTVSGNQTNTSDYVTAPGIAVVDAVVNITNSTVVNNTTVGNGAGEGGGIAVSAMSVSNPLGVVNLNNVTVANNSASVGGGLVVDPGTINLSNTIVANNQATGGSPECYATGTGSSINSKGNNIIGNGTGCTLSGVQPSDKVGTAASPVDAQLAPLQYYGGPTQTVALNAASPALNAGNPATCAATDQRGATRPQGAVCDIGAFETLVDHVVGTVVEFYNTNLKHYFVTANTAEQASIDAGGSGPGWTRTGLSFKSNGVSRVCRFYGTPGVGPNSHFYTVDAGECAQVKLDPGWHFESNDFSSTAPASPANCPSGTVPVYRAYNNRFAFNDSNHRLTTDVNAYNSTVAQGWIGEGIVMCAPA